MKYNDEVQRINRTHWTVTLGDVSSSYLRAINHKFSLWENIKLKELGDKSTEIIRFGEVTATHPPQNLFVGNRAHDLGSILLTRDIEESEENHDSENSS